MRTPMFKWAAPACFSLFFISALNVSGQLHVPGGTGGINNNTQNTNVAIGSSLSSPTFTVQTTGTGNVGIGVPSPQAKLQVAGPNQENVIMLGRQQKFNGCEQLNNWEFAVDVNSMTQTQCGLGFTPFNSMTIRSSYIKNGVYNSGLDVMHFDQGGNVGIGNTSPSSTLDVTGTGHFTGKVSIGTTNTPTGYGLYVKDGILCEEVKVAVEGSVDWADYVFEEGYYLRDLTEVENFIQENKHLPDVPSAKQVVENGLNLGDMDATLLRKVEELTLYVIELQKQNEALQDRVDQLEQH